MRDGFQGAVPGAHDAELPSSNAKNKNYKTTGSKNT